MIHQPLAAPQSSLNKEVGRYRPEVDGLRAIAVAAVILNHFDKSILPSGYLGVDVFFVISGFVITSSLARRTPKDFREFLLGFYARRAKRLLPALVAYSLIAGVLITLFSPGPGQSLRTGIAGLFGMSNILLFLKSSNYFGTSAEVNAFTHTWSLGVEEQFYFIFPAIVWATGFARGAHGARRLKLLLMSLSALSLLAFISLYSSNFSAAYYLMPMRFWEIGTGSLMFLMLKKRECPERSGTLAGLLRPASCLALGLLVAIFFIPQAFGMAATLSVVLCTTYLIATVTPGSFSFRALTHPALLYIGLISYSLYLWHWGVLSISRWTTGVSWFTFPWQLALIIAASIISYEWLEKPLRRMTWSPRKGVTILLGVFSALVSSALLVIFGLNRQYLYAGNRYLGLSSYPDNVIPDTQINHRNCMLKGRGSLFDEDRFQRCTLSGDEDKPHLFFIGDSHSMHLAGLGGELNKKGYGISFLASQGLRFRPELSSETNEPMFKTDKEQSVYSTLVGMMQEGDVVVLSNRYNQDSSWWERDDDYFRSISAWSRKLMNAGMSMLHVLPLQEYSFADINQCSPQWFNRGMRSSPICSVKDLKKRSLQAESIRQRLPEHPGLMHFQPIESLCPEQSNPAACSSFDDSHHKPVFSNPDHLSDHGASLLSNDFEAVLRALSKRRQSI